MEQKRVFPLSDRRWTWALPAFCMVTLTVPGSGLGLVIAVGTSIVAILIAWSAMSNRVEVLDATLFFKTGPLTTPVELTNIKGAAVVRIQEFYRSSRVFRTLGMHSLPFGYAITIELERATGLGWLMPFRLYKWLLFRVEREDEFLAILEAAGVQVRREAA